MEDNETYDLDELKDQIDLLKYVQKYVPDFEYKKGEYWSVCPLPNHKEDTPSFSINQDKQSWWCFGCGKGGNIFDFVMAMEGLTFYKSILHLVELFDIQTKKIPAASKVFKKYKNFKQPEENHRTYIDTNSMSRYSKKEISSWIDEGILPEKLEKYDVRIDERNNRIVFPIFDNEGKMITISGRTMNPNYKDLGIEKYIYYSKIGMLDFFYGYYQNRESLQNAETVVLFEGAKSVMKCEGYGYDNCMAVLTSHIATEQVVELIKMNCKEVLFALDSDVKKKDIVEHTKMLRRFKLVSYIYDKDKLLENKMSPVDMGKDVWDKLYFERKIIR